MKGLMLTLMLTWTGMAMAQQNYGSQFRGVGAAADKDFASRTGSPSPETAPIVRSNETNRSRTGFGNANGLPAARQGDSISINGGSGNGSAFSRTKILPIDNDLLNQLQQLGMAGSTVDPSTSQSLDRIAFAGRNAGSRAQTKLIEGRLIDRNLIFQLSSSQLANSPNSKFVYDIPQEYRGRYNAIVVEDPESIARLASTQQRTGNPSTQSSQSPTAPRWKIRGLKDQGFEPTLPDRQTNRSPAGRDSLTTMQNEQQRQQRAAWETEQQRLEKQRMLDENRNLKQDNARLNQLASIQDQRFEELQRRLFDSNGQQPRFADRRFSATEPNAVAPQPMTGMAQPQPAVPGATASLFNEIQNLKSEVTETKMRLAASKKHNEDLQEKLVDVAYRSGVADDESFVRLQQRFKNGPEYGNNIAGREPPPNQRPLINMGAGNKDSGGYDFGDNDTTQTNTSDSSITTRGPTRPSDLMLFILLMISVSINVYLWWMSRNFHSRYQQLADELRETFTSTV